MSFDASSSASSHSILKSHNMGRTDASATATSVSGRTSKKVDFAVSITAISPRFSPSSKFAYEPNDVSDVAQITSSVKDTYLPEISPEDRIRGLEKEVRRLNGDLAKEKCKNDILTQKCKSLKQRYLKQREKIKKIKSNKIKSDISISLSSSSSSSYSSSSSTPSNLSSLTLPSSTPSSLSLLTRPSSNSNSRSSSLSSSPASSETDDEEIDIVEPKSTSSNELSDSSSLFEDREVKVDIHLSNEFIDDGKRITLDKTPASFAVEDYGKTLIYHGISYIIPSDGTPIIFKNGSSYIGGVKDGKRHGYGNFIRKQNGVIKYTYYSHFKNDLLNGYGELVYASGSFYKGNFLNHKFHGEGVYVNFKKGKRIAEHSGQFKNNFPDGDGVKKRYENDKLKTLYDGRWKEGKPVEIVLM